MWNNFLNEGAVFFQRVQGSRQSSEWSKSCSDVQVRLIDYDCDDVGDKSNDNIVVDN